VSLSSTPSELFFCTGNGSPPLRIGRFIPRVAWHFRSFLRRPSPPPVGPRSYPACTADLFPAALRFLTNISTLTFRFLGSSPRGSFLSRQGPHSWRRPGVSFASWYGVTESPGSGSFTTWGFANGGSGKGIFLDCLLTSPFRKPFRGVVPPFLVYFQDPSDYGSILFFCKRFLNSLRSPPTRSLPVL